MASLDIKPDMLVIALDGDGIGKLVGRAVIANDAERLHEVSHRIDAAQAFIVHWANQNKGIKISGGGDEATVAIPKEAMLQVECLRKDIEHAFGYTVSVGVGKDLAEAGTALLVAKLRGKDRIVHYSKGIEYDIKKAKRRVREKRATPDEYKLAEAYLKKAENMESKDCPYCKQTDGIDPSHCVWCHDAEQKEGEEACPYCESNASANISDSSGIESDDCPFCRENPDKTNDCPFCLDDASQGQKQPEVASMDDHAAEQANKIRSPDTANETAPAGSPEEKEQANAMGMNPPINGKPEIGDNSPQGIGMANPADAGAPQGSNQGEANEENQSKIPEEGAHSKEALQAIAQQIESETAEGKPEDKEIANQIDDTQVTSGDMEDGTSRPEGYEENTPGDLGLDEENAGEPDLSSVLQEGLDNHADEAQKEKVRTMIGQALTGFKASKDVLERAKEQAPDFYNASIAMLAAMINMAEMLGLKGKEDGQPDQALEDAASAAQSGGSDQVSQGDAHDWNDPFPKHPDHGGEKKPGHAPSQEERGGVGQPIGKLPTKHTTTHVAKEPIPVGGVNAKGQKKVQDAQGNVRFIDMKSPRVQGPAGVPVKAPPRG